MIFAPMVFQIPRTCTMWTDGSGRFFCRCCLQELLLQFLAEERKRKKGKKGSKEGKKGKKERKKGKREGQGGRKKGPKTLEKTRFVFYLWAF